MKEFAEPECGATQADRAAHSVFSQPLGQMRPGSGGRILAVGGSERDIGRGLLEMGFVEGARIDVLHHGWLRRDPLAVRINRTMTVALRRCEANAVLVGPLPERDTGPVAPLREPLLS